ncbi:MAG: phosphodiesterase [Gammaproteobacteria bacterium]|nr:phosphodiesterase [Gammaproteobacteria bacterium]
MLQAAYWSATSAEEAEQAPGIIPDPDTADTEVQHVTAADDHIAQFTISYLEPGNTYAYDLIINRETVARPDPLRFQTQQLWEWRTDPPTLSRGHRLVRLHQRSEIRPPRIPTAATTASLEQIAARNPDFMLWMGDNVYYREVDWAAPTMMAYRYAHTRATPEMQALLGHTHNYATWDDHDYGPNNADRSHHQEGAALDIFKRYWANPTYGLPDVPGGVPADSPWADIDFFVLDDRYHRSRTRAPRDSAKTMWGEAQLTWLIDALTSSSAPFKVVVNGGQILNPSREAETLARFPDDRQRLIDALIEHGHWACCFLGASPLHGAFPPHAGRLLPAVRVHELFAHRRVVHARPEQPVSAERDARAQRNFGTLTFSGPRTDRSVTLRTYDSEGEMQWERTIRARDLRPPEEE